MKPFIGVLNCAALPDINTLKRMLIAFDALACPMYSKGPFFLRFNGRKIHEDYIASIDWLHEKKLFFDPRPSIYVDDPELFNDIPFPINFEPINTLPNKTESRNFLKDLILLRVLKPSIDQDFMIHGSSITMIASHFLDKHVGDSVPIFVDSFILHLFSIHNQQHPNIHVVLDSFPVPDPNTSFEQIIDFKSDPDSREKYFRFRHWIKKFALSIQSPNQAADELEYLYHEYESHMRLHKMKVNKCVFEIVITTTAEILEDLVKFRLSKLMKLPFSFRERKFSLLEAENSAPGKEIAYLVKASEEFIK